MSPVIVRATRRSASGKTRSATLSNTVRTNERTIEMTSHGMMSTAEGIVQQERAGACGRLARSRPLLASFVTPSLSLGPEGVG
jgi:hypothetical protein